MTIIPQQWFGLGDNIFTISLLQQIAEGGKILYPVMQQNVDGLQRAYPDVTFIDYKLLNIDYEKRTEVKTLTSRILPIRFADQLLNLPYSSCMLAKYQLYGLDWQSWRDVMHERSKMREQTLKEIMLNKIHEQTKKLGLTEYQYNLISPYYGSGSQYRANIEPDNGLPNIYMSTIPGYSLFDFSLLIQNATEIHAVSSSIIYLLELLPLQGAVHLYPRERIEPKTWLQNIEYILTKNYIIHDRI